jgi:hypothetical protein
MIVSAGERPANGNQTQKPEGNMNEKRGNRGPNLGLLLLVPVAVIIAKGAMRRRAMWESGWSPGGAVGRGHGHHAGFAGGEGPAEGRQFRLPPKIEWMLDSWHTRAHETTDSKEPATV